MGRHPGYIHNGHTLLQTALAPGHHRAGSPAMQWCPVHQAALVHGDQCRGDHWIPLPWGTLAVALAYAKASNCLSQIQVHIVPCPQCGTQENPS